MNAGCVGMKTARRGRGAQGARTASPATSDGHLRSARRLLRRSLGEHGVDRHCERAVHGSIGLRRFRIADDLGAVIAPMAHAMGMKLRAVLSFERLGRASKGNRLRRTAPARRLSRERFEQYSAGLPDPLCDHFGSTNGKRTAMSDLRPRRGSSRLPSGQIQTNWRPFIAQTNRHAERGCSLRGAVEPPGPGNSTSPFADRPASTVLACLNGWCVAILTPGTDERSGFSGPSTYGQTAARARDV